MDSGLAVFWATVALVVVTALAGFRRPPKARVQYLPTHLQRGVILSDTDMVGGVEGGQARSGFSTEVRIVNTGRTALPASEWEGPLHIEVSDGTKIISVSQIGATPIGLHPDIRLENNSVIAPAFLMNPGDMVSVQLLCEGTDTTVTAHARINNVLSIKRRRVPYPPGNGPDGSMEGLNKLISYGLIPAVFVGFGIFLSLELPHAHGSTVASTAVILICWWGLAVLVYPLFMWRALKTNRLWRPVEILRSK